MERHEELFKTAAEKLQVADHVATMTFPLVRDPKLLFLALENIFLCMSSALQAALVHARTQKRIPAYSDTFEGRIQAFKDHLSKHYAVRPGSLELLRDIKNTILEHKNSPVEFTREGKFIICSNTYKMKVISTNDIKNYIVEARSFLNTLQGTA